MKTTKIVAKKKIGKYFLANAIIDDVAVQVAELLVEQGKAEMFDPKKHQEGETKVVGQKTITFVKAKKTRAKQTPKIETIEKD